MKWIKNFIKGYISIWLYVIVTVIVISFLYMLFTWEIPTRIFTEYLVDITVFKVINGVGIIGGVLKGSID